MALCYYVPYFYLAAWATEIFCVIRIIASDDNPDYKVPWLLFVLIIPIAGFMLYFMFYSRTLQKRFVRRLNALKSNSYKKNDDDDYAMIGTINLDYRSLVHHFENGVWMYKCESVSALKEDIEKTLNDSIEVTPNMLKTNLFQKFIRAVVRIFAPML
ncbi:MAG: PLDc N-terminal domain-containing protein [Clostridia bacterium]|nr:PLDc N-terminal domain-containing protein [Clostridia bacterium]